MYSYLLEELSKAIGARLLVRFDYKGESFTVEPHLLGRNHSNEDCLCGWLTTHTAEDGQEGWYCFLFSHIKNLDLLEDRFSKKRPGYDPYDSNMSRIYYRF
ncbi:hypothetical protein CLV24_12861 [Pontibacter ummariensis]|uniref:WYL domain-containing protein n=1 Tax=Pontibacter ummariensis TaxID=1610492 RepID=A0A239K9I7_9BACT|nr:hypothetical protein CLV24_12861 [Pontibacter ummariensis]SNT15057.1 hypothetical protein SAMN06296052_12761 [Pontibacter ummariensis]